MTKDEIIKEIESLTASEINELIEKLKPIFDPLKEDGLVP